MNDFRTVFKICENFEKPLALSEPKVDKNDIEEVIGTLKSGNVSSIGQVIVNFENEISKIMITKMLLQLILVHQHYI